MAFHLGFTGTQTGMTNPQRRTIVDAFQLLADDHAEIVGHHGDCIGADAHFDAACRAAGASRVLHVPEQAAKRAFCDRYTETPVVCLEPRPYLVRNHDIVDVSTVMLATPKGYEEEVRSGTWATIRYAQKVNRSLFVIFPDGHWLDFGEPFPTLHKHL